MSLLGIRRVSIYTCDRITKRNISGEKACQVARKLIDHSKQVVFSDLTSSSKYNPQLWNEEWKYCGSGVKYPLWLLCSNV